MKTLHNCFPNYFRNEAVEGVFGLEIETEVEKYADYEGRLEVNEDDDGNPCWTVLESQYWRGVYDGSLRNYGVEYIFSKPLDYVDTMLALEEFDKLFKDVPFLKDQPGTSVHVHLNFQNLPLIKIANFVATWALVENLMLEFSGKNRRSNLFARGHRVADWQATVPLKLFDSFFRGDVHALSMQENQVKYAALNLGSLQKLGTLEVRCFRGTTDILAIRDWVSLLYGIYSFAEKQPDPKSIFNQYKMKGEELVKDIFGCDFDLVAFDNWKDLVWRNEFNFAEYALAIDDWSLLDEKYSGRPAKPREKKLVINTEPAMTIDEALNLSQATVDWNHLAQGISPQPWPTAASAVSESDPDLDFSSF